MNKDWTQKRDGSFELGPYRVIPRLDGQGYNAQAVFEFDPDPDIPRHTFVSIAVKVTFDQAVDAIYEWHQNVCIALARSDLLPSKWDLTQ